MSAFIGIDVSKATLDVAIRIKDKSQHFQVKNSPAGFRQIQRKLVKLDSITRIALEASGRYGEPLALWLFDQGYPISYLNPKLNCVITRLMLKMPTSLPIMLNSIVLTSGKLLARHNAC